VIREFLFQFQLYCECSTVDSLDERRHSLFIVAASLDAELLESLPINNDRD
jgi:hypothetical protein